MLKQSQNPYGYRNLLVYPVRSKLRRDVGAADPRTDRTSNGVNKKAEELQIACSKLTHLFPKTKTLIALADQMDRSARSTKQNITEGWKRNTTNEYYQFLGYAIASNAELEEDFTDIWKGMYPELMGVAPSVPLPPLSHSPLSPHLTPFDIEKLPFYPIDPHLSFVVQLKLRAKELNFLLDRLQKSLADKMTRDHVLPAADKLKRIEDEKRNAEEWYEKMLAEHDLVQLEDGRVVKKSDL